MMQTFLPYPSALLSVKCLDYRRLGKQRVEARQIVNALTGESTGWRNHPAVQMWAGHVDLLKLYCNFAIAEWEGRGYKNNMEPYRDIMVADGMLPAWWGNRQLHRSHKSNLLRKDPVWYGQYGWDVPDNLPYYWPTKEAV